MVSDLALGQAEAFALFGEVKGAGPGAFGGLGLGLGLRVENKQNPDRGRSSFKFLSVEPVSGVHEWPSAAWSGLGEHIDRRVH